MVESEPTLNPWTAAEEIPRVEIEAHGLSMSESMVTEKDGMGFSAEHPIKQSKKMSDGKLGVGERAFSAAGAAFLSAIIVNPLDVVKVIKKKKSSLVH